MPARRSRLATGTVVRALLAVAIVAWLLYSTGVDVLLEELSTIAWPPLLAVFGAMAIETTLRAFAWGRAMALAIGRDRASLRRADILRCYLASSFMGAVVPSSAGTDVVRAVLGRRYFGGELASHAAAIVGLNLIGWFAGAAVGCVGLLMVMATTDSPEALAIPGLVVVVALVALPLVFASLRSRVLSTSIRRGLRRSFAIRRQVRRFTRATRATAEHPGASLAVLGLSIAAILAQSAEYVAASQATGIAVPIGAWLLLPVLLGIAGLVPASLLGFGVNQALIVGVLAIFGVGAAESLACAMLIAVAALAVKILGGSAAMILHRPVDARDAT